MITYYLLMKKYSVSLIFLLVAGISFGQTVDDVIGKYVDAMGGAEKLKSINSVYMEGVSVMQNGNEVTSKTWKVKNQLMRREVNFGMGSFTSVLTDKEGWISNPRNGNKFEAMPKEMVDAQQSELDVSGPLVDYKAKGHTAELTGKEVVDGAECYAVKLTLKSGRDITYYIDTKTNYINSLKTKALNMRRQNAGADQPTELVIKYSDYRKTADGFTFPFATTTGGMGAATNFEKIEVNKPVDPKLYKPE